MKKKTKENLTPRKLAVRIQNVREIVVRAMKSECVTPYRLAKMTGVTEQTLRNFVGGTHEMRSDKLAKVLAALKLEIRPKS